MTIIQQGIVLLIKSAITGEKLDLPRGFSIEEAAPILMRNGMITLGYAGAINCGISNDSEMMQRMQSKYCMEFVRSQWQLDRLEAFYQAMEENGIEYMPVKGAIMKYLYPSHEMRPMGDADILFHIEDREKLEQVMTELGYTFTTESDHEWNWKCRELKIELHKRLVSSDEKTQYSYFGDGWEWAKNKEGCRYTMNQEDAFIFEFAHFTRHYCKGGIGLRHIVDLWVHLYNAPNMDKEYVRTQMDKLRLGGFYDNVMTALDAWFGDGAGSQQAEYITQFVFGQGKVDHGEEIARSAAAKRGSAKQGKFKVFLCRLFPARKHLDWNYPQFKKLPLPIAWVARWFSLLGRKNVVKNRLEQMKEITDDQVDAYRKSLEFVGLDILE